MFLMIENNGVAPVEAFTLLGDSGTRNCGVTGVIGQFGSGTKHAINLLLRKGIEFHIYSGKTRLEFFYERTNIQDANGGVREAKKVKCRLSGDKNRTIDCGWVLDFGALDWRETSMALREFVSNAIDCSKIMGGEPVVRVEPNRRARAGHTRVFVSVRDPEVSEFHRDLSKHFLHFSEDPSQVEKTFLRKNPDSLGPRIYREGVFVRELASKVAAAYDYNFKASEIEIDESRNSNEYNLRAKIARLICVADSEVIEGLFDRMSSGEVYESSLDEFYLGYYTSEAENSNWQKAWEGFAGDAVIANERIGNSQIAGHAEAKGHKVKVIKSDSFVKVAELQGVPNIATAVGSHASNGRVECEATPEAVESVDTVWSWLSELEMTNGRDKPEVKSFKQLMDGEGSVLGFYQPGTTEVNIREDLGGGLALKVALEECGHYVTGAMDGSRDFQNFFIEMVTEICK